MASAALDITFPGNLSQVEDAATLRLVPASTLLDNDLFLVSDLSSLFVYDAASLAADDGALVIRPANITPLQAGRWVSNAPSSYSANIGILRGASPSRFQVYDGSIWLWSAGNYTGQIDDLNIIGSTVSPVTAGAWVRQMSSGVTYKAPITGSVTRTVQDKSGETLSIKDTGAKADNTTDATAAFNLAAQAGAGWTSALEYNFTVPSGTYRLNGTSVVRKGQTLNLGGHGTRFNASLNTTVPIFLLGGPTTATQDPGGSPVKITDGWVFGGPPIAAAVQVNAQGAEVSSMFLTAVGIGVALGQSSPTQVAGDVIVSDVTVDQSLVGFSFTNAQNCLISNSQTYLANFGMRFRSTVSDFAISNMVFEYTKNAAIYFDAGATEIRGIAFTGCVFTMNAQFDGAGGIGPFAGYVYNRASQVEATWTGCTFRNMRFYALNHESGTDVTWRFAGCAFDGLRTKTNYDQSTTARVLVTGSGGDYSFDGCDFLNLYGEVAYVNNQLGRLQIRGGNRTLAPAAVTALEALPETNAAERLTKYGPLTGLYINTAQRCNISVQGMTGMGYVRRTSTHVMLILPWWFGGTEWKVTVRGNNKLTGDSDYSRWEELRVSVSKVPLGPDQRLYLDKVTIAKSPTRTDMPDLNVTAGFGVAPGGATDSAMSPMPGFFCLSVAVPAADQGNFKWTAETMT